MEITSQNIGIISRSHGRSAVQMSAYCSRSKFYSEYTGEQYDYTKRQDLVYHEVLIPPNAPEIFKDSETLWNSVEQIEHCRNSQLARSMIIALPKELDHATQIRMVKDYAEKFFIKKGMCADISIHDKGEGNPHVHILLTMRSLDKDGRWMPKQHRNYILDGEGKRIVDPITGKYKLGKSIKVNDWDNKNHAEEWRKGWADMCNQMFREKGIEVNGELKKVTHMSYARQGIDKEPTIHLGAGAKALERRGIHTSRGNINRSIQRRNNIKIHQLLFREKENLFRERDQVRER